MNGILTWFYKQKQNDFSRFTFPSNYSPHKTHSKATQGKQEREIHLYAAITLAIAPGVA